jgi:hypothetical protein
MLALADQSSGWAVLALADQSCRWAMLALADQRDRWLNKCLRWLINPITVGTLREHSALSVCGCFHTSMCHRCQCEVVAKLWLWRHI